MRLFNFTETQPSIDAMIKLIYFEDKAYFDCKIQDLIEAAEQRDPLGGGGLADLLKSFTGLGGGSGNGGGMDAGSDDFLMKMLSSLNDE